MRLEKDDAKIGLLVFLTLGLFVALIFQRSLATILRKEAHVQVRLASAADVAEGTDVQLQGLRVGQVEAVQLERDGVQYRFLVSLGLRPDIVLWEGSRVLVVSKPLGGAYLDLELPPPAGRRRILADTAILDGDSGPTLVDMVGQITTLVGHLDQAVADLRGEFERHGLGSVLDHPAVSAVLRRLDQTLQTYGQLGEESRGLVRQGSAAMPAVDRSLASLDQSLAQVRILLDSHQGDLDAIVTRLAATLKEMEGLSRELRAQVQRIGPDGDAGLKSLDRTLRATEELLELLKAKPNRLLWGKPTPAERAAAASKVEAARQAQGATP